MKGKKVIIVILLIVASMVVTISTYKNFDGKKVEEVEEKSSKDNILTFHVQQDSGNYTEYTSGEFPGTNYQINRTNTTCTDVYGNKINTTIEYINGSIVVNGSKTVYCEIYLDKCKGAVGTVLEGKEKVSSCEIGGMYRYQGTDDVNNWICFGSTNQTDCKNKENYGYRIIGVTPDNQLKLIKETSIPEGNYNGGFQWNDKSDAECGSNGEKCTWSDSMIFKRLNGTSNGSTGGSKGNTNIFIGYSMYGYLNSGNGWLNKIATYNWKYGDVDINNFTFANNINGDVIYSKEVSQLTSSVSAKIGLIYPSEYAYAYPGGNPGSYTEAVKSWIHYLKDGLNTYPQNFEWTIVRSTSKYATDYASLLPTHILKEGVIQSGENGVTMTGIVRPTFYLIKDLKIKSGTGTSSDPYILDV